MGNQNTKKWFDLVTVKEGDICVAIMAVFEEKDIEVSGPVYIDPVGRKKIFLEAKEGKSGYSSWIFEKLELSPKYHEINIRFPKGSKLGRKGERKPFDIRNQDKEHGFCFLRIQPGCDFEEVFLKVGILNYKISVYENKNNVKVILWSNPKDLPSCLR